MRILKSVGIVIAGYLLAFLGSTLIAINGTDETGTSGSGVALLALACYWGYFATKVGYRSFDFSFMFIPFYGIFWAFKIAHRVALLPNRDWPELGTKKI